MPRARAARACPRAAAPASPVRVVARRKRALVFLRVDEVWAFEAADRLACVHAARGRFDVDLSLAAVEASFGRGARARAPQLARQPRARAGARGDGRAELVVGDELRVPVARERAAAVRELLLANTAGVRRR